MDGGGGRDVQYNLPCRGYNVHTSRRADAAWRLLHFRRRLCRAPSWRYVLQPMHATKNPPPNTPQRLPSRARAIHWAVERRWGTGRNVWRAGTYFVGRIRREGFRGRVSVLLSMASSFPRVCPTRQKPREAQPKTSIPYAHARKGSQAATWGRYMHVGLPVHPNGHGCPPSDRRRPCRVHTWVVRLLFASIPPTGHGPWLGCVPG